MEGDAIDNGLPLPTSVVPHPPVYHPTDVPTPPETVRLIFPASFEQKLLLLLDADNGAVANGIVNATEDPYAELGFDIGVQLVPA